MPKVEHGEYTAWTVNGTPRYSKNGKILSKTNINQDIKQELDVLLEKAASVAQTDGQKPTGTPIHIGEPTPTLNPGIDEAPKETIQSYGDLAIMQRQIEELKASQAQWMNIAAALSGQGAGVQMNGNKLVGINEKFSTDKGNYPDPTDRLGKEGRLSQFAFGENYFLEYTFRDTSYTDINNQRQKEPQFQLTLNRYMFDENGYRSARYYAIASLVMHEDPDAAIAIARENGLSIEMEDEKAFLDEMRYLRFRDWLFELFFPPRMQETKVQEQVINNRPVRVFEASSENPQSIPFDQLRTR